MAAGEHERDASRPKAFGHWEHLPSPDSNVQNSRVEVPVTGELQCPIQLARRSHDETAEIVQHLLDQNGDHNVVFDNQDAEASKVPGHSYCGPAVSPVKTRPNSGVSGSTIVQRNPWAAKSRLTSASSS